MLDRKRFPIDSKMPLLERDRITTTSLFGTGFRVLAIIIIAVLIGSVSVTEIFPVTAQTSVSNLTVILAQDSVNTPAHYTIEFTSSGTLTANTGEITIIFPQGTKVPESIDFHNVSVNGTVLHNGQNSVSGNAVTMTVPQSLSGTISVVFTSGAGIKNPRLSSFAGDGTVYRATVYTTVDDVPAKSDPYDITTCVAVTPTELAYLQSATVVGAGFAPGTSIELIAFDSATQTHYGVDALQPGKVNEDGTFTLKGFGSGFGGPVRVRDGSGREAMTNSGNQCLLSSSSFPTIEDSTGTVTPEEAFASVGNFLTIAWTLYAPTQSWQQYNLALGANSDMTEMVPFQGYWIHVSEDCTLTWTNYIWDLKANWNLIGWPG